MSIREQAKMLFLGTGNKEIEPTPIHVAHIIYSMLCPLGTHLKLKRNGSVVRMQINGKKFIAYVQEEK